MMFLGRNKLKSDKKSVLRFTLIGHCKISTEMLTKVSVLRRQIDFLYVC